MTGKAAAMTKAVQEAGGERTIGMGNGSRRTAEDNEKRARVNGTFADNREVKSAVGARLSNAKRRQCPSAGKSCVSAVMPRAARIGEPNRSGRNMNQQRPTHGFRQRRRPCRRGEGMRRAGILRSVYVRTHDARDNCEIRPEICPDTRTAQILWNALPQFRWKNNVIHFRILKIHPLFAHRRRNAEDSSAPDARFPSADAHPSAQRGYADNLRSGHIRARDNRGIRPEICPNIRTARNFFENFKKISFSVQRTGTKYRVYNIRTLLCTSKCSASRAFLRPHTQNSHPIPCKPVNIRKPAHGLKQIRSEMCKTAPDPD